MPRRHLSAPPDRPMTRNLAPLLRLLRFVRPYLGHVTLAAVALLVAAGAVLAFGQVIREVVDHGLKTGSEVALTRSLLLFLGVVAAMAGAIMARSYLLGWIGERVIADVRTAVFDRVLALHVGFFETAQTGEIISRLTSDTTLLQVVVGSTLAMALRTLLLVIGGTAMLALTSPHLTGLVLLGTPLVVLPVWLHRFPAAPPVPGKPGPDRGRGGLCRRGAPRHPHRAGVLSRAGGSGALPGAGGVRLSDGGTAHPAGGHAKCGGSGDHLRGHRGGVVDGGPRGPGRAPNRRRAVRLPVLCGAGGQFRRPAQRAGGRAAAGGRGQRAADGAAWPSSPRSARRPNRKPFPARSGARSPSTGFPSRIRPIRRSRCSRI